MTIIKEPDMKTRKEIIEQLSKDWLERDHGTFVKIKKEGRLGWEKALEENSPYSSYLINSPSKKELIKRAYPLAKQTISAMNIPSKVSVKLAHGSSHTDGKEVFVATNYFDDDKLTPGQMLDIFLGLTVHEGSHLLYTETDVMEKAWSVSPICASLLNIIEDERIERELGEEKPGLANYLIPTKQYYFGRYADKTSEKKRADNKTDQIINSIIGLVRYPAVLSENEMVEFGELLLQTKDILTPYPASTEEAEEAAEKIYELILKEYMKPEDKEEKSKDKKKNDSEDRSEGGESKPENKAEDGDGNQSEDNKGKSGDKSENESEEQPGKGGNESEDKAGDDNGNQPGDDKDTSGDKPENKNEDEGQPENGENESEDSYEEPAEKEADKEEKRKMAAEQMEKDFKKISKAIGELAHEPMTEDDIRTSGKSMNVSKELLDPICPFQDICEGIAEIGSDPTAVFRKMTGNKTRYDRHKGKIKHLVPGISRAIKGKCRDWNSTCYGMRSGMLDTNKLAEAVQGVPSVYTRKNKISSNRAVVCVLVDESGSMYGRKIDTAKDTAILLNEALGKLPNVDLYMYGHSADLYRHSTDIFIYKEKNYAPGFALGDIEARANNRDGLAILEVAKRMRKFTDEEVLMFVISDGEPSAEDYWGSGAIRHTKESVKTVESMGFRVMQICIENSYDPAQMFSNFIKLTNMNTLAKDFSKMISKTLDRKIKVRETGI